VTKAEKEIAVAHELQRAQEAFAACSLLVDGGFLADAVSRLYYSLLYRVKALLLTEGLEPKSHEGALPLLHMHFVNRARLDPGDSQLFARLMKYREEADYSPSIVFTAGDLKRFRDEVGALSEKIFDLIRAAGFPA